MSLRDPDVDAETAGVDTQSRLQREFETYQATLAPVESFTYGPIALDGTVERLFDYWIHGQDAGRRGPRWSVLRDVLGWVE